MKSFQNAIPLDTGAPRRRQIGTYLREARSLSDEEISRIAACQEERGLRFGEAALALGLVDEQDVLDCLGAQFDYSSSVTEVDRELAVVADPFGEQAEVFRELRSRLLLEALPEGAPFTLAVLSPHAGDGKTYIAANLAAAFSQLGERTLLIDADLRAARLESLLGRNGGAGLSNVLAGLAECADTPRRVNAVRNLWFMAAGALPPNPLELLQRASFQQLLAQMKERFDRVVVDTSAASRGADCRVVAARCEASIVVARKDETRWDALQSLVAALERSARIAGVVMNER